MSERLSPNTENPFRTIITERLGSGEIIKKKIAVIAISGTIGSGSSSTSETLCDLAKKLTGLRTHFFSSGDEMRKLQRQTTGQTQMDRHYDRSPQTDRDIDKMMGVHMIDTDNANSLIVAEGRLAPYVARELQYASLDLGITLPSEIVTVFMTANENVRYMRKYLQELKNNPTISQEEYFSLLENRKQGELTAFGNAYPELMGQNPYNVNFELRGKPVYDFSYDTTSHTAEEIALDILTHNKVQSLLSITGNAT